ncbi:MAG: UTP--glucose-1-phosphate uridylyltransferase GalU [Magnetococcales bacterium]|nr:UTP--glucose-1-phosphate uridylyltransferase GalU [Magnetococcales bacterium]
MAICTAVLPVAGLGTRFLPITKSIPKEMLPVVDQPLIQYVVEEAWSAGIEQVVLVSSRGKTSLEDHFDSNAELESALDAKGKQESLAAVRGLTPPDGRTICAVRQHAPLGLGHAVLCARAIVGNNPFAVLLPDDLIWTGDSAPGVLSQLVEQFEKSASSVVAVMEVEQSQTCLYGVIDPFDSEIDSRERLIKAKGLVEKPKPDSAPSNLAVVGRYILTPEIFNFLSTGNKGAGGEIQLTDAICALLAQQSVYGYRFEGVRFDCGDKAGYQMANIALSLERPDMREQLIPFIKEQLLNYSAE